MDCDANPNPASVHHGDLYPHFTTDEHGNIIARANGHTVTIYHADRDALRPGWIRLSGHEGRHADANGHTDDCATPGNGSELVDGESSQETAGQVSGKQEKG